MQGALVLCIGRTKALFAVILILVNSQSMARASDITFLCAGALRSTVEALAPQFMASSGHKLISTFTAIGAITNRVRQGEPIDLAIVSPQQWDVLMKDGKIDPSVKAVIARVGLGLFVKKGSPKPAIGSVEAFKRTLSSARTFALADPSVGSPVGAYAINLFERLGMAEEMKAKLKLVKGIPIEPVVANDAEIGLAQISEILPAPGVELVGPLPAEIQNFTVYTAAIPVSAKEPTAAKSFIAFLTSVRADEILKSNGLER